MEQKTFLNDQAWEKGEKFILDGRQVVFKLYSPSGDKFQVQWIDMHDNTPIKRWYPINELPPKPIPTPPIDDDPDDNTTDEPGEDTPAGDESPTGHEVKVGQIRGAFANSDTPFIEVLKKNDDGTFEIAVHRSTSTQTQTHPADKIKRAWWRILDEKPIISDPVEAGQFRRMDNSKDFPYIKVESQRLDALWNAISITPDEKKTVTLTTAQIRSRYPKVVDASEVVLNGDLVATNTSDVSEDDEPSPVDEVVPDSPADEDADVDIEQWRKPVTDDEPSPMEDVVKALQAKIEEEISDSPADEDADVNNDRWRKFLRTQDEPVPMTRDYRIECAVIRDKDGFYMAEATEKLNAIVAEGYRLNHIEYSSMYIPHASGSYVETVVYWTFVRLKESEPYPIPF